MGDARSFVSGRQLAVRLGLMPRQNSGRGKNVLFGISVAIRVYEHCLSTGLAR
ncbi:MULTISPECIES: hypothetical protein [unclassified Burkholderia]|uniref:hypothetical protein n=1 Tax=unclassified Burkholderia TaxID=2613784 RepID=UPI001E33AEA2|nr:MULTISPECIES: hypothetical protein [unclassified Burkholderia]